MRDLCLRFCLLLLGLPSLAIAQWVDVQLTNAGFEEWDGAGPVGWEQIAGIDPDSCIVASTLTDTTDAAAGVRALLLRGDRSTCRWSSVRLPALTVVPGEVYRLRGQLKALAIEPEGQRYRNAQVFALVVDQNDKQIAYYNTPVLTGTTAWAAHEVAFQIPPGAASMQIAAFLTMPGALLVDDLSLARLDPPAPTDAWSEAQRWSADLDYIVTLLTTFHPQPFAHLTRDTFLTGIEALKTAPAEDTSRIWRLRALLCGLGDSHTGCGLPDGANARLPLALAMFGDEMRVVAAAPAAAALCGGRIVAVDGRPVATVLAGLRPQIAFTHENWFRAQAPDWMRMPVALHALGLVDAPDAITYTVVVDTSTEVTVRVALEATTDSATWTIAGPAKDAYPLYRRQDRFYWFEYLPDSHTLYLKYDRASDDPERPLRQFGVDLVTALDAHPIERFVFDLRHNSGGSNLLRGLFKELARRVGDGRIGRTFVITGRRTFSAAVYDADAMRRDTGAVVVGEATGMAPIHPGQIASFTLPGTGLKFDCSTKMIQASNDTSAALMPDVPVEVMWEDFLAGRDPVLDAVLKYERP
ncbi:MAG: hypothetical protein IPH48_11010 [bacterium]|jgi:hypothetical protein|nr:hypothetical protein [bacterium]